MSDNHDDQFQDADQGAPHPQDARVPRRQLGRRLLKAGVMAVPFVLTLRGRPAQADIQYASPGNDQFFITGHTPSMPDNQGTQGATGFLETDPGANGSTWSSSSWTSGDSSGEAAESGSN